MGNNHWGSHSFRKGKFGKKRVAETRNQSLAKIIVWGLALVAAFLFFIASFGNFSYIETYFDDLTKIVLILLSMGMVFISIHDKKEKIFQKNQKESLAKTLTRQRKVLKNHFDLQKKISSSSALNFAVGLEETLKNEQKVEEKPSLTQTAKPSEGEEEETVTQKKVSFTQINLAKSVVEGEDISSFPAEWQQYFVENEGKNPSEKLNKMLDANHES